MHLKDRPRFDLFNYIPCEQVIDPVTGTICDYSSFDKPADKGYISDNIQ